MERKITFISDTHGRHEKLDIELTGGWMIIHAGDVSNMGEVKEINKFTEWFSKLPYEHKIFIAGNHDFAFEKIRKNHEEGVKIPDGVIYLQDESVTIDGIKIYGSPWQPEFMDWAFNLKRGDELMKKWEKIPSDVDILVTHGPAWGHLDITPHGMRVGCEELYKRIVQVAPKIHVCGHIHFSYGMKLTEKTIFINASSLNELYEYENLPIVLDYDEEY